MSETPITADAAFDAIVSDMRAYVAAMSEYIKKKVAVYSAWPLRLASYYASTCA